MSKSEERQEFLTDVMTTAAEGGIGYWSQLSSYRWDAPYAERGMTVHEMTDDESGYKEDGVLVTPDTIAAAIGRIRRGEGSFHDSYRVRIVQASRDNDCGELDSLDCDLIVQMAVLGEVVYG